LAFLASLVRRAFFLFRSPSGFLILIILIF
jgi:hypothetical protein